MVDLLVGGIVVASAVAGLFFLRFWKSTNDRFFLLFALAFWIEGLQRFAVYYWFRGDDASPVAYLPRLLAYALIIIAIAGKNRAK